LRRFLALAGVQNLGCTGDMVEMRLAVEQDFVSAHCNPSFSTLGEFAARGLELTLTRMFPPGGGDEECGRSSLPT